MGAYMQVIYNLPLRIPVEYKDEIEKCAKEDGLGNNKSRWCINHIIKECEKRKKKRKDRK